MNLPLNKDLAVRLVTSLSEFESLRTEWDQLVDKCPQATVFQTFAWNFRWWCSFRKRFGRRLLVVTLRSHGPDKRLVGIAPLMTGFWYSTPLRRISFIGTGTSDYLDIIAADDWSDQVIHEFYAWISKYRSWWVADLQQLREGAILRSKPCDPIIALRLAEIPQEPCPYLNLSETWNETLATFGKKTRSNINYYDRNLHKTHEVAVRIVASEDELTEQLETLFELHSRRWNKRWLPGVFSSQSVRSFHHTVAKDLLQMGLLRLFYITLDGETQASLYCFAGKDRIMYYQGGFEPTLANMSLGTVLTSRAIQQAINEGKDVFDFLRGDEPYKQKWTKLSSHNCRQMITSKTPGRFAVTQCVQRIADQMEYKAKRLARKLR